MIEVYNILNDSKQHPMLNCIAQLNVEAKGVSIEKSVEILNEYFDTNRLTVEHAYLIGYNISMDVIGIYLISIGNTRNCYFYKKSIATFILLTGTERFLLFHNHPDGNLQPSDNDIINTAYVKSLADILEVEFIDSVIISRKGWRSINGEKAYEYDEEDEI